jgi:hypothetical protein
MINLKPYVSAMEASNGLTGLIVENTKVIDKETNLFQKNLMLCGYHPCVILHLKVNLILN